MRNPVAAVFIVGLMICLSGCDRLNLTSTTPVNAGKVAVLDLDEVARRIGRDVELAESIQQRESSLNSELATVQASYQEQIAETKDQFGQQLTDDEAQQLNAMQQDAVSKLNQYRLQAQTNLNQHRTLLLNRFREEVKPVARSVAAQRGLTIVLTKNETVVLAFESAVDITDAVVERMLAGSSDPRSTGAEPKNTNDTTGQPPFDAANSR